MVDLKVIKGFINSIRYRLYHYPVQRLRKIKLGIKNKNVYVGKNIKKIGYKGGKILFNGKCQINDRTSFCFNKVEGYESPTIVFGKNVIVGKGNDFGCACSIILDDFVLTAPYVHFSDRNHGFEDVKTPIVKQEFKIKGPIYIGPESWIGFGAQIMSGVSIGKHCVIGAGCIVTKDIPDYCVVGGNPAKILKRYNFETQKWEKV